MIVRLGIRMAGLVGILYVVRHWALIYHRHNGSIHFERGEWWKLVVEICFILVGLYMISGAPLLLRLVTDKEPDDADKNSKNQPSSN